MRLRIPCPDCGVLCGEGAGLASHRFHRHGIARVANPGRAKRARAWRANNPEKIREWNRRSKGRGTSDYYRERLTEQGGGCAICGAPEAGHRYGTLHVDHDHETGRLRGLLCQDCNFAVGLLHDDPQRVRTLLEYLESWE